MPEIIAALQHHPLSEPHRRMIGYSLEHLRFGEQQILDLDEQIRQQIEQAGYQQEGGLLQTLPGVQPPTAAALLAEMGPNPKQFASEKHLSSWAGRCPGHHRSAGRSKSGARSGGNRWLRGALTEGAWGIAQNKECPLRETFWRIAAKSKPQAVVAVAHDVLVLAYFVLQRGTPYEPKRGVPLSAAQRERLLRHHVRRRGKLGLCVRTSPLPRRGRKTKPGASCTGH